MSQTKKLVAEVQMNITLDCGITDPVWFVKRLGKLIDTAGPIIGMRRVDTEWIWLDVPKDQEEA